MAIIQASHVGYDPATKNFGSYRRLQMDGHIPTPTCGKICGITSWYEQEYRFARENINFARLHGKKTVIIDNQLLNPDREEGLLLHLEKLRREGPGGESKPLQVFSTAKAFEANLQLQEELADRYWQEEVKMPIGDRLSAEFFQFRRNITTQLEDSNHLETNLIHSMPHIITSPSPALAAAQVNTQVEFDRAYRSIVKEESYQGKNLAFIAGIHIDISPKTGQIFPLTKFVPWAAYIQTHDGRQFVLEQSELMAALREQSTENRDQIDLEEAIAVMEQAEEVIIKTGH